MRRYKLPQPLSKQNKEISFLPNSDNNKQLKLALIESEASLKLAQEIGNLGIWQWLYKEKKFYFSDELYRIFGISDTNKKNYNSDFQYIIENYIHPDYKNTFQKIVQTGVTSGIVETTEYKILREDGEIRWVRTKGMCINDIYGNPNKMVGTTQDITEWKNAELLLEGNCKFLQTLIDTIPNPIFYKDENGIYKHCNLAFAEYLGLKREEIIGHTVYDISPKDLAAVYHKADMELMQSKGKQVYEAHVKYSDQSIHDILFSKGVDVTKEGLVVGIVGSMIDITDRKKMENRITKLLKLKELMLEINHAILQVNDIKELFILVLEKITEAMGNRDLGCVLVLDTDENLKIIASKGYDSSLSEKFSLKLKDSFFWNITQGKLDKSVIINDIQKLNFQKYTKVLENTVGFKVDSSISTPILLNKRLYGLINIDSTQNNAFDESDLEIMEYMKKQIEIGIAKYTLYEETVYLSRYDKLTNVYNRRYFEELFNVVFAKARRYNESFFVVIFDINGLKYINDTYGHLAGDELIKTFASRLSSKTRTSDIFARFGGDEFVAVFWGWDLQSIIQKLEGIVKEFANDPIFYEENTIICSFSYGISNFPQSGTDYNELIGIADKNMYEYKQKLKNKKNEINLYSAE